MNGQPSGNSENGQISTNNESWDDTQKFDHDRKKVRFKKSKRKHFEKPFVEEIKDFLSMFIIPMSIYFGRYKIMKNKNTIRP